MKSFTTYKLDNTEFPQKQPPCNLIIVKALSTAAKFALPLVLESIYKNIENSHCVSFDNDQVLVQSESFLSILFKITISLSLSYFLDLFFEYILVDYRMNLKKELTKRIVENSIKMYCKFKEEGVFYITQGEGSHSNPQKDSNKQGLPEFFTDRLTLWTNISNKMPVYVYNYQNSLLSLVFESLNIIGVCAYLFIKLSYSLVFGLILAIVIMRKIISVTQEMQSRFFKNIQLRQRKLQLLKHFFNHLVEYKMTWLDKWIWHKIQESQSDYQKNLQEIKYLDVWCVALWRFTSVSISSAVVVAFYLLGIETTQTITPSTLIQFLMILTMPLNALSWNIAGVRNSLRAIKQLKYTICSLNDHKQTLKIDKSTQGSSQDNIILVTLTKDSLLTVKFKQQEKQVQYLFEKDTQIERGRFVSVQGGKQAEHFMNVWPFYLKNKMSINVPIGYIEQNCWQIDNILESLTFKQKQKLGEQRKDYPSLQKLLEVFDCHEIPQFSTITSKQLSGGQKMRVNLVRAFLNSKVIVINSDLTCVDVKMRQKIAIGVNYLIKTYNYTVFCRTIEVIGQTHLTNVAYLSFINQDSNQNLSEKLNNKEINRVSLHRREQNIQCSQQYNFTESEQVKVDPIISLKLETSIKHQLQRQSQIQQQEDPSRSKLGLSSSRSLDSLKFQTLKAYYKSKYHIVFLVGIISTTVFEHLYQFYMNNYVKISSLHDGNGLTANNIKYVLLLTLLFAASLFVRAYYFAVANIKEGKRISSLLDRNLIMNEMDFYENFTSNKNPSIKQNDNFKQNSEQCISIELQQGSDLNTDADEAQENKRTTTLGSKMIYHSTTDIAQVSDNYPWQANILFNNIFTTTSSILIVFSEIPFIGVILIPIIIFTVYMNNQYQFESQRLLKVQKKVEQNLLKTVHEIEEGIKYIYLFGKVQNYKQFVYRSVDKQLNIEWKLAELKRTLNTKYKTMMIIFLVIIVLAFGLTGIYQPQQNSNHVQGIKLINNPFESHLNQRYGYCGCSDNVFFQNQDQQRNKSGKFAMLINYTITLANFMLYFTVSLGDTSTHALAIERIRPLLSKQNSEKSSQRIKDCQKVLNKIKSSKQTSNSQKYQQLQLLIENLNFSYTQNNKNSEQGKVFSGLLLGINQRQKIQIRGKSGNGKTTLYKLLCSLYKESLNTIDFPFHISFSPQHPLILPLTLNIEENIDPYGIYREIKGLQKEGNLTQFIVQQLSQQVKKQGKQTNEIVRILEKSLDSLTYKEKIIINNLRAWLYGKNGIKIYDEPYWVDESESQTYILTTHQREFKHMKVLYLQSKKLIEK